MSDWPPEAQRLLEEREVIQDLIEARKDRTITDRGFGMGEAELVYQASDGARFSVTLRLESIYGRQDFSR